MNVKYPLSRKPILPDRVRQIGGQSFAFVPHRFLRDGFFAQLTSDERSLYLFLVLAADRCGVSLYGYDRICSILEIPLERYLAVRDGLLDKHLIAFDGTRFQVLSLPAKPICRPSKPLHTHDDLEEKDPATIRQLLCDAFSGPDS